MIIKTKNNIEINIKNKSKLNVYYNKRKISPNKHLNKVKRVCLATPCSDGLLFIWIVLSFYNLEIRQGQRNKYTISRSNYKFKDLLKLIKQNYKQYIIISLITYIIINLI